MARYSSQERVLFFASLLAWFGATGRLEGQGSEVPGDTLETRPFTADVRAPLRSTTPAGFLSAGNDESEVQIEGGWQFPTRTLVGPLRVTLAATAPVNEDSDERTGLGGLSGLDAGTVFTVGIGGMYWKTGTQEDAIAECLRLQRAGEIAADFDCDGMPGVNGGPSQPPRWDLLESESAKLNIHRVLRGGRPLLYEFSGRLARQSFGYLAGSSFDPTSETRTSRSIGGDVGVVLYNGALVSVGAHYEFAYSGASEAEICVPFGSNGATRCRTGALEAPSSDEGTIVNAQVRRFLSRNVAMNPRFRYRIDDQEWDAEVTFYVAPDPGGGLIGGVAPGYDSRDGEVNVRVFVGAAFDLGL